MSYRITEDCVSCGDCSVVCPEKAIDDGYLPRTGDGTSSAAGAAWTDSPWRGYRINDSCTSCGNCVEVCPTGAIVKDIIE
ncbi:MAG: 4Fe-4S binding protein [Clostridia bacterium]|jgi:ferredoxin|nr:4Fe-4S binding protein [Clostridia bacterium]